MTEGEISRPEHPRPDFRRTTWLNLNGIWDFRFDPNAVGDVSGWHLPHALGYDQQIVVPFPWQSRLSGRLAVNYQGIAWYRRTFTVPDSWWGGRIILRFGAVDYWTRVWVNGRPVGEHEGGYTPFEFDITAVVQDGENEVVVRAEDPADLREIPHGKQGSIPPDPWYACAFTPSSGIWQTVWLELRPPTHWIHARITPDVPGTCALFDADIHVATAGAATVMATVMATVQPPLGAPLQFEMPVTLEAGKVNHISFSIPIPNPHLWEPDVPHLYQVALILAPEGEPSDTVHTYFGMRQIEVCEGQICLNGRPLYFRSALDQGFWPEGIHTAPSDEALRADVAYAKALGLNGLRKHIKIEDPRFAYWADVLGLLLWCDAPSPTSFTEVACQRLARDLQAMIERDYNHPSIIVWCPYNESWGLEFRLTINSAMQAWVATLYDRCKAWDATRLVVDNSGWSHVKTDIADFHYYTDYAAEWRSVTTVLAQAPDEATVLGHPLFAQGYRWQGEPLMMSEYGGGWKEDRSWSLHWQTAELRRHPQIVGYTYTELYDIEYEYAGYALYDRTPKDFGFDPAMLNCDDFVILDYRGPMTLRPGELLSIAAYASVYGKLPEDAMFEWQFERVTPPGQPQAVLARGNWDVTFTPYSVTPLPAVTLTVPDMQGPVQLWAWLTDAAGKEYARNYLDFEIFSAPLPGVEKCHAGKGTLYTLRFAPSAVSDSHWSSQAEHQGARISDAHPVDGAVQTVWGVGHGYVEYQVELPSEVDEPFATLMLRMEAGSRPSEVTQSVHGRAQPTELTISMNEIEVATRVLPDLHRSARGSLTRLNRLGPGEHGDLFEITVPDELLPMIEAKAREWGMLTIRLAVNETAVYREGLTLFGARSGRYGLDPTLVLTVGLSLT